MKRVKEKVVQMHEKYPYKNSPQSLTLESEIKRISDERGEAIELTIERLAGFSGISVRQIYNYRNGKCDIPSGMIPVFCNEFGSNALAMAILKQCQPSEEIEDFDLVRLATHSARQTLQVHDDFLKAFEDDTIDGFELNELKRKSAAGISSFHRLEQIAEDAYKRRRAA